jgi:thiol-disulfide isomerase/thioredoxin
MKNFLLLFLFLFVWNINAQELPNITLKSLDGKSVTTQEISNSENLKVLSFWATWCVPCINELDAISEVYEKWQDETNVEIIAISTDDSRTRQRVKPLVNGKGWDYQVLIDENQDLKRALNITTLPHVVIIKNGEIVYRHSGYTPGGEDELFDVILEHSK